MTGRAVLAALVLTGAAARAHEQTPSDRAIVQFRAEATEILYEAAFPAGPDAARWRLKYDLDHDGRLSDWEQGRLAEGLALAVRARVRLKLEGAAQELRVLDAKVTDVSGAGAQAPLAALALLGTREMPPGLRKIELSIEPLVDRSRPVLVRVETGAAKLRSLVGGGGGTAEGGVPVVLLRRGETCTMVLDVPTAGAGKAEAPSPPDKAPALHERLPGPKAPAAGKRTR